MGAEFSLPGEIPAPAGSRRFPRKPVLFARVEFGQHNVDTGIVLNVSEGGLCAQNTNGMVIGSSMRLRIHCIPSGWVEVNGKAVWRDEAKSLTGIAFLDLAAEARDEIRKWLSFGTSLQGLHERWIADSPADQPMQATIDNSHAGREQDTNDHFFALLSADESAVKVDPDVPSDFGAETETQQTSVSKSSRIFIAVGVALALLFLMAAIWTTRYGHITKHANQKNGTPILRTENKQAASPPSPSSEATKNPNILPPKSPGVESSVANSPGASAPAISATSDAAASAADVNTSLVLQVASMSSQDNARTLVQTLIGDGLPAFVSNHDGEHFYRVLVGPFRDKAAAAAAKQVLIKRNFPAIAKHWTVGKGKEH